MASLEYLGNHHDHPAHQADSEAILTMNMIENVTKTNLLHKALKPMGHLIFVFGSNEAGIHGAGAAREALEKWGARRTKGIGLVGQSFAIPTKDHNIHTLPLEQVKKYVAYFLTFAMHRPELHFMVTQIGCGLAGFKKEEIAPLFKDPPKNCSFDTAWHPLLGDDVMYWGTVP